MAYNVDENPQTIYTLDEEAIAPSVPDKPVPEFTIEFYIQPRFYIQPWHESPEEILKMLSQQIEGCDRLIQQCAGILSTGYDATIEQDLISTEEMRDRLVRNFNSLSLQALRNKQQEAIARQGAALDRLD